MPGLNRNVGLLQPRGQTPATPGRPMSGVRAVDLTNVLTGPFYCRQLAHMGANVIKVEVSGTGGLA